MHNAFARFICRALIACLIGLPFQAQAGLIGTEQAVAHAQAQAARAKVAGFIDRGEAAGRLQALGLSPEASKERIAALTDAEVAGLAGRIEALPAGGVSGALPLIIAALLYFYLVASPATAVKEPAKEPAKAPAK